VKRVPQMLSIRKHQASKLSGEGRNQAMAVGVRGGGGEGGICPLPLSVKVQLGGGGDCERARCTVFFSFFSLFFFF